MKKPSNLILSLCLTAFVTVSALSQVNADYNRSTDFSKYKTYSFAGWQDDSGNLLNDIDKDRLRSAFKEEFGKRDMEIAESNSDAFVILYFVIKNETSTSSYTNFTGGMGYGVGRGWGMGVGGRGLGTATTTYSQYDYQVGTLVVDIYDTASKELIWQGTAQNTLKENASKREKAIPKEIKKLMKKYPIKPVK